MLCLWGHGTAPLAHAQTVSFDPTSLVAFWQKTPESRILRSFTGLDVTGDSLFLSSSITFSPGRDVDASGFLLRGGLSQGLTTYHTSSVPGGKVETRETRAHGLVGYQWTSNQLRLAGFAGVDYQRNQAFPADPGNQRLGERVGFMTIAEADIRYGPAYFGLSGSYSTVFDSYWARLRAGLQIKDYLFGPDMLVSGAVDYDSLRLGLFLQGPLYDRFYGALSAGHGWTRGSDSRNTDSSFYTSVGVSYLY
ncbi:cellulose biosynthesis protein BcsS [Coralliovum pocilloporae]|uniref:cellulose biosynthesis protein BcsS n=1 Tax=Coralliovum pocilloporae TaxID=3066369 RepID=UPI003306E8B1